MISFRHKGDFSKLSRYLEDVKRAVRLKELSRLGEKGVRALASATPVRTGLTANSWYYEIEETKETTTIRFCNSNIQNGIPIAVILQHGHGTNNGGWVEGRDYINPAIQPIFDEITNQAWREVTKK